MSQVLNPLPSVHGSSLQIPFGVKGRQTKASLSKQYSSGIWDSSIGEC